MFRRNYSEGLRLGHKAHRIAVTAGNKQGQLASIGYQALCWASLGDFGHCVRLVKEGKELTVQTGMLSADIGQKLLNIEAEVYQLRTEHAEARHVAREGSSSNMPTLGDARQGSASNTPTLGDVREGSASNYERPANH
ncbi:hypothetical protein K438DRAFT_1784486 [Mycena galopus ATCC 62051]|nr:hypothetical protein K438DRAFT_1784486 [Mycena galopus ATCC 62051]